MNKSGFGSVARETPTLHGDRRIFQPGTSDGPPYSWRSFPRTAKCDSQITIPAILVLAFSGFALAQERRVPERGYRDWRVYGGTAESIRYSALTQIHRGNVQRLELAWTHDTGDATEDSEMPCNPIVIGDADKTMRLAMAMQDRGFDIRGIRPPSVPEGTSRLRISLTLNAGEKDVNAMLEALGEEKELLDQ